MAASSLFAPPLLLLLLVLFLLISSLPVLIISTSSLDVERRTFIVRVDPKAKPSVFLTHSHWYQSTLRSVSEHPPPDSSKSNLIIHTYENVFHGFAATLSTPAARRLSSLSHIISLIPEQVRSIHTTHSPEFLGLRSTDPAGLLKESDFGSDLVIGVIDTGIFPKHRSFGDHGLTPIPSKWKGDCSSAGEGFPVTACNKKLIGARFFCEGYESTNGRVNTSAESRSARDSDGHGTHTASIAAGRYVAPAAALGYARGIAAGMAPKARLAVYKVCWGGDAGAGGGCYDSDILRAFDGAIADGVDVISLSVGGAVVPYHLDSIAIAAFAASAERGIFVSASAGNGGPAGLSVTNVAPWVTTVGAGTLDRSFPADVILGDGKVVPGVSIYGGPALARRRMYPVIYGGGEGSGDGYSASLCLEGSLSPKLTRGKIVVCDRGINSRAAKGEVVKKAGGVGMIMANGPFDGEGLVADCHVLPATSVGAANGEVIRRYISRTRAPRATIVFRGTRLGVKPAPMVAAFSARGPNPETPEILKPDLIAPGLNILAAWPEGVGPAGIPGDKRRTEFNILSGTSMACPHVSGLAALLKAAHPDWSPAAIRSALMTTAYTSDNTAVKSRIRDESTGNLSTPLDYGAGHVHPQKAIDPGLLYDLSLYDYIDFLCNSNYTEGNIKAITRKGADCRGAKKRGGHVGNLNYPSLSVVFQEGGGRRRMSTHFIRTVTNVGEGKAVYKVRVEQPRGTTVTVEPKTLVFRRAGQKLSFLVRVRVNTASVGRLHPGDGKVTTGKVVWSDGRHVVASPLVVAVQQPVD